MSQAQGEVVVEGVVVEQPAEPAAVRATTAGEVFAMDRTAAAAQDVAVEEGLEPPVPTAPGWHLLEEERGVKRWRAFDPEMQKQLDSMEKSRRTVARFTGFAMSEMDALSPPLMSLTQHRDRYEVHFPSLTMRDLVTKRDSRIYRAPGDAPYPVVPPKPEMTKQRACVCLCLLLGALPC